MCNESVESRDLVTEISTLNEGVDDFISDPTGPPFKPSIIHRCPLRHYSQPKPQTCSGCKTTQGMAGKKNGATTPEVGKDLSWGVGMGVKVEHKETKIQGEAFISLAWANQRPLVATQIE